MTKTIRFRIDRLRDVELSISRRFRKEIPPIDAKDLLAGPASISLIDLEAIDGHTTYFEQFVLLSLAKFKKCRRVFELGTFDGRTSANLALNLIEEAEIFTLDIPADQITSTTLHFGTGDLVYIKKDRIGAKCMGLPKVKQLYGDTATFDFSPWFGTCDLVFVDACHELDYVMNDSDVALRLRGSSGVILWHDYGSWIGVTNALNELYRRDDRYQNLRHITGTSLCVLE